MGGVGGGPSIRELGQGAFMIDHNMEAKSTVASKQFRAARDGRTQQPIFAYASWHVLYSNHRQL
jgi:hypothetical protein